MHKPRAAVITSLEIIRPLEQTPPLVAASAAASSHTTRPRFHFLAAPSDERDSELEVVAQRRHVQAPCARTPLVGSQGQSRESSTQPDVATSTVPRQRAHRTGRLRRRPVTGVFAVSALRTTAVVNSARRSTSRTCATTSYPSYSLRALARDVPVSSGSTLPRHRHFKDNQHRGRRA